MLVIHKVRRQDWGESFTFFSLYFASRAGWHCIKILRSNSSQHDDDAQRRPPVPHNFHHYNAGFRFRSILYLQPSIRQVQYSANITFVILPGSFSVPEKNIIRQLKGITKCFLLFSIVA